MGKTLSGRNIRFLDGSRIDLYDVIKSKTSWPPSQHQAAWLKSKLLHAPQNCVWVGETLAAEGVALLGQKVVVVKMGPPHGPLITDWRAPDLGCVGLQYHVEDPQPDGSNKLVTEDRAVSLQLVEPGPALFDEGRDYEELRPSALLSRMHAWSGVTSQSEDAQAGLAIQDGAYDEMWAAH